MTALGFIGGFAAVAFLICVGRAVAIVWDHWRNR